MKTAYKILILSFSLLIFFLGCNKECDDCLELTTKNIKYIHSNGTNLLFGSHAFYNPDSVIIKARNDTITYWKQLDVGTIMFNLEENYTTYHLVLSDSLIDTLDFELAERKSTSCCGNVIYSKKTFLNGHEIENNDLLMITH